MILNKFRKAIFRDYRIFFLLFSSVLLLTTGIFALLKGASLNKFDSGRRLGIIVNNLIDMGAILANRFDTSECIMQGGLLIFLGAIFGLIALIFLSRTTDSVA
mgnify:CR=1 FL=1